MSWWAQRLDPSSTPGAFPVAQQRDAEPSRNLATTGTRKVTRRLDQVSVTLIECQQRRWRALASTKAEPPRMSADGHGDAPQRSRQSRPSTTGRMARNVRRAAFSRPLRVAEHQHDAQMPRHEYLPACMHRCGHQYAADLVHLVNRRDAANAAPALTVQQPPLPGPLKQRRIIKRLARHEVGTAR